MALLVADSCSVQLDRRQSDVGAVMATAKFTLDWGDRYVAASAKKPPGISAKGGSVEVSTSGGGGAGMILGWR